MTRRLPGQRWLARLLPKDAPQYEGVRFLLHHVVGGIVGAVAFLALILAFDLGGLRQLILESRHGWLAGALLLFGLIVTFGSVAMAAAVMLLGRDRD
ncbi:hypothetical protein [Ferruginivarius sediminum]|uniref:Uncharacterized protein n=1 Tax=Ferruginivarius sediminum TaxID=2661937 RepID=A0A369TAH2_9PROT|nr:hypothetical protein [Ferruginivarius sediminum]RDD61177.1 hypothetical protein DRB17_13895 [Ferruginivarius sediminum]